MGLELHYRSDGDLGQPRMQVESRDHIARCLRDYVSRDERVSPFAEVVRWFMYVVRDDVVDTVIGPRDYIEQVANERRQTAHEARPPLPRKEHNQPVLGASPLSETRQNELPQEPAGVALRGIGAGAGGLKGRCIYRYRLRLGWIASLFIRLACICDAALLDVLGESSRNGFDIEAHWYIGGYVLPGNVQKVILKSKALPPCALPDMKPSVAAMTRPVAGAALPSGHRPRPRS